MRFVLTNQISVKSESIYPTVPSPLKHQMRGISRFCLGLLLLPVDLPHVLSHSSREIFSRSNKEDHSFRKARLRSGENVNAISPTRLCGAHQLSLERKNEVQKMLKSYQKEHGELLQGRHLKSKIFNISTYVHVVYKGNSGDVTNVADSKIIKQIDVLNDAFNGSNSIYKNCGGGNKSPGNESPFRFFLKNVTRTLNDAWHYSNDSNYTEMVKALRKGSCADLNIFIDAGHGEYS